MTTLIELAAHGVLVYNDGYRTKQSEYSEGGYRILRAGDVRDGRIWPTGPDFVDIRFGGVIGSKVAQEGDVVLTTKGTVGRVATVRGLDEPVVYSPQLCFFRTLATDLLDAGFLHYWLMSPGFVGQAGYLMGSSDMAPYISLRDLGSVTISLPDFASQQAIAEVLGALDDKIAANARVIEASELLCEAAFVRLVSGTEHVRLGDIAQVNAVGTRPGVGELRYLDIGAVGQGSYDWPPLTAWESAPGRARRVIRRGDTVWSTVRPNRRSHALILDEDPRLVGSTGLAVLTPSSVGAAFLYQATKTEAFLAYLEGVSEGSAYPAVRAERFGDAPVPDVLEHLADSFEQLAMPTRQRCHQASVESRHLAHLRDTLLPPLMSGRITVREAERAVSDVL